MVRVLAEKAGQLAGIVGRPITVKGILVRDPHKKRPYIEAPDLLTTEAETVLDNPEVDIVVEVMGGEEPALAYLRGGISRGKHLVTANKEVMARHGRDLLSLAHDKGVHVMFEASVAGGTPVIAPLLRDLVANEVVSIHGIVNGTTNYILTRMSRQGVDFEVALREAQELGYAEADPSDDIEGVDAAYKLAILSSLAFRAEVKDTDVYREGITRLRARDFLYAAELGYSIKLMAMATKRNGSLQVRVHPIFVPADAPLAKVDGVLNAVEVETDLAGRVLFHGQGAGPRPTASAVVADIVHVSRSVLEKVGPASLPELDESLRLRPMSELETKYYIRMTVADRAGVLAQTSKVLGDLGISLDSVIQKRTDHSDNSAEVIYTTHRANEAAMQRAIGLIEELNVVVEIANVIRVEEWDA